MDTRNDSKPRRLRVCQRTDRGRQLIYPELTLGGRWLEEGPAGLREGDHVDVHVIEPGETMEAREGDIVLRKVVRK